MDKCPKCGHEGTVTIRIRIGDWEFEVTGPRTYAGQQIEKFIWKHRQEATQKIGDKIA